MGGRHAAGWAAAGFVMLLTTGTLDASCASLAPVPLPGAVWLLGSALLGLAAMVRRRA
jgi:hypothetical protein